MIVDTFAVILDIIGVVLSTSTSYYCWKIGKKTGFVSEWKKITSGFIMSGFGWIILAIANVLIKPEYLHTIGLTILITSYALILLGKRQFKQVVTSLFGRNKNG